MSRITAGRLIAATDGQDQRDAGAVARGFWSAGPVACARSVSSAATCPASMAGALPAAGALLA